MSAASPGGPDGPAALPPWRWLGQRLRRPAARSPFPAWFLLAALLALALRGLLWWQFADSPFSRARPGDEAHYWEWAGRIAAGAWRPDGVFYQGPLFPYLLALLRRAAPGLREPGLAAVQLLANWLTCLLFWPLLRRRAGPAAALAAATLALFFAPAAFFALKGMPTTLGLLLVTAGLAALPHPGERWGVRCVLSGGALGLAVLAVPSMLLVVGAAAACLLLRPPAGNRLAAAAALAASALVPILPATASNYAQDGSLVLVSADFGIAFLQGNNPAARGWYTQVEGTSTVVSEEAGGAAALARREAGRPLDTQQQVSAVLFAKGLRFVRDEPGAWLRLTGRKALLLAGGLDVPHEFTLVRERRDFLPALWALPLGGTAVLLLASLGLADRTARRAVLLPSLAAAAVGATCLLFFVTNRFACPFQFLLLPAAGAGALGLRGLRARPLRALALLPVAAAALLTAKSLSDPWWEAEDYLPKLALAYDDAGNLPMVVGTFERMLSLAPRSPTVYEFIASAYRKYGDDEYALWAYEKALSLDPEGRNARFHRATILASRGRRDEARADLERILAKDPGDAEAAAALDALLARPGGR